MIEFRAAGDRELADRRPADYLPSRIDMVNRIVPLRRRAQVVCDRCVIACAAVRLDEAKLAVLRQVARPANVDECVISRPSPRSKPPSRRWRSF